MDKIDIILTSFARWDLLEETLTSFFEINTYPINNFIIYEDKGLDNYDAKDWDGLIKLQRKFTQVKWITPSQRCGQIKALDALWSKVETEYVLTLEDDWVCLKDGFVKPAIEILEKHPRCCCVWLRGIAPKDVNFHPIKEEDGLIKFSTNYHWKGFSFGVGIKRKADYDLIGSYSKFTSFNPLHPFLSEQMIGHVYFAHGFFAASLKERYFIHIGEGRGIRG